MSEAIIHLESPIDVMYLIHKALSAEALKVERLIRNFEPGDSLQSFKLAFNEWAAALLYHADIEDEYMTKPMDNCQPARDNEAEHGDLHVIGGELAALLNSRETPNLQDRVKSALYALTEEQHTVLMERLQDVLDVLEGEIGRGAVIARTKRHLYRKVVELRVTQDDHLESEEAFVLPLVRDRFTPEQEYDLARRLLVDAESECPTWVLDWMKPYLEESENEMLTGLLANPAAFTPVTAD